MTAFEMMVVSSYVGFAGACCRTVNLSVAPRPGLAGKKFSVLVWLRAQVLLGGLYLRPKMSGSVPRPVRIIKYPSGERDKVCIPRSNDRLSLVEISDKTDCNHRDPDGLLYCARKGNLITCAPTHQQ